jgi:hypothetical protein
MQRMRSRYFCSSKAALLWVTTRGHIACLTLFLVAAFASAPRSAGAQVPKPVLDGSAKLIGRYNPNQMLRLVIALRPPNMEEERQFLQDLQTIGSPLFRRFLTPEEWDARFGPTQEIEQAIVDWARSRALTVTKRYPDRLIVDLEGQVATIERAFGVTINSYQLGATTFFANDREPAIPANLNGEILAVIGLNDMERMQPSIRGLKEPDFPIYSPGPVVSREGSGSIAGDRSKLPNSRASRHEPAATNKVYGPHDLYNSFAYSVSPLNALGHCCNPLANAGGSPAATSIAVATAGSQNPADFIGFHMQYPYLAENYSFVNIDGTPACCDPSGTLIFEWATAMANDFGSPANTAHVFLYDGANNLLTTFTDIYNQMATDNQARVFVTGEGCAEIICEPIGTLPNPAKGTMLADDAIFMKMVGQGWTLIGDSGAQGATADCSTISVNFPASDPNVIAVGSTTLTYGSYLGGNFVSELGWTGQTAAGSCAAMLGGSGGGCSKYWPAPAYQPSSCVGSYRSIPDVALNGDPNTPQADFFGGNPGAAYDLGAPELAGLIVQVNAYLLHIGAAPPIGNANSLIYAEGTTPQAPHYPFYDITSGCNSNDVTAVNILSYDCAAAGYDLVTGWGSVNMLQLVWALMWYTAGDGGAPRVTFSGPAVNTWYKTDQTVTFNVVDTSANARNPVGVSGFSQKWDADPGDAVSSAITGCGRAAWYTNPVCYAFYDGPQFPNATSGSFDLSNADQGCHTAHVRAWDNTGIASPDQTYGPVCYDTIPPETTFLVSGATITLSAADPHSTDVPPAGSGVASTVYQLDSGTTTTYVLPFKVLSTGVHTITWFSTDKVGNVEPTNSATFTIQAPTTTTLVSSLNPSTQGQAVTFTATVTPAFGSTPTGTVTFHDGTTVLGKGVVNASTHQAVFTTSVLGVGSHSITAGYGGDANFLSSTSRVLTQVVN